MFNVTADLLMSIVSLRSSTQTAGSWTVFVKELGKIRDHWVSENLHFVPSADDVNADYRKNITNGIAICMDVLFNALNDPDTLLEDISLVKKEVAAQQKSNPF